MEFKDKTVEAAIEAGLKELGIAREDAQITVLDQGGFLRKARVEILPAPKLSDAERAAAFVEGVVKKMRLDAQVKIVSEEPSALTVSVSGKDSGMIIGYRGDVLDAVQYLASLVYNSGGGAYKRLTLDCENYREKREDILKGLARKLAGKAARTGKRVRLEPMNPSERRIIHSALQEFNDVSTSSEGTEPNRYIVITPKNARRGDSPRGDAPRHPREDRPFRERRERRDDARPAHSPAAAEGDTPPLRESGTHSDPGAFRPRGERRDDGRRSYSDRREGGDRDRGTEEGRKSYPDRREGGDRDRGADDGRRSYSDRRERGGRREGGRDSRDSRDSRSGSGGGRPAKKEPFSMGFGSYLGNTRKMSNIERRELGDNGYEGEYVEPERTTLFEPRPSSRPEELSETERKFVENERKNIESERKFVENERKNIESERKHSEPDSYMDTFSEDK